jgi:hypothetical protein
VVTTLVEVRDTLGQMCSKTLPTLNVYNHVPRSLVPPAAIVRLAPHNAIDYEQQYSSGLADYMWTIMLVIGQVDDEAAQDQIGELITPNSPLIVAINNATFPAPGWAKVQKAGVSQMMFGKALYSYAELSVRVTA